MILRIRINIMVLSVAALGAWSCAPRTTPAPVVINGMAQSDLAARTDAQPKGARPGQIVVQPGDTLIALARYHQAGLQALVDANNLTAPYVIKPGQVLKMPGAGAAPGAPGPVAVVSKPLPGLPSRSIEATSSAAKTQRPSQVPIDAGEDQTSGFELSEENAHIISTPTTKSSTRVTTFTPSAAEVRNFRWPAKGPVLSEFGPKQNGLHNDGINIAMPPNSPVHAADSGVVSYAGNELRGYGNLLLIRHDGGWITAYAHNSQLLVGDGERVTRGQIIARAGRTGGVDQDQVHFEIRKNAKAVDPRPLLVDG